MKQNDILLDTLYQSMINYYQKDPARIQHFAKVHSFARLIGRLEGMDEKSLLTLEAAAFVHDIGIKPAEELYGNCDGKKQEELGPGPAREMLEKCGFEQMIIDRVAYLVGHHHTYTDIDGMDYQILVEADFLVNLFEGKSPADAVETAYERIFRTKSGKEICRTMFGIESMEIINDSNKNRNPVRRA